MRNNEDSQPTRYAPRGDRGREAFGGNRERDWKERRPDTPDRRGEAQPARPDERSAPRGSGPSSGGRPPVEDMDVFRLAHDLAVRIHELTSRFPAEERGSIVALLRRASAAVPAQLAAGASRWDRAEYHAAVTAARDAAAETRYFLLLTKDLGHVSEQDCNEMREAYERVTKMLAGLAKRLQQ